MSPSEEQLKVAYLYNFTKFVAWPADAFAREDTPFHLCILGTDPFGPLLDSLAKKSVQGRPIVVSRLTGLSKENVCQLLYISASFVGDLSSFVSLLEGKPVLTIGEVPGFIQSGGMINFVRLQEHLRFEVHPDHLQKAGLKASAAMLQVAIVVR
ncbi:MAG: YfiR family protein [Magnetococcales bacterium]|nr:YfiR family protein [Magnetococcales bacterium]NGZ26357.1 YfiR family protein [Magnetococcales bacterium]